MAINPRGQEGACPNPNPTHARAYTGREILEKSRPLLPLLPPTLTGAAA